MPLVKVEMLKGRSPEYKEKVFECIHDALVEALNIEEWDRFQRIIEYDRCDFEYPSFKTDSFMLIELTIFPGRTSEQKGRVIEGITGKLNSRLSVDPGDVFITINEPPLENWGIGGNQKG